MFTGLIGVAYLKGVSIIWLALGLFVGQSLAWYKAPELIRGESKRLNVATLPTFLVAENNRDSRLLVVVSGLIILVFLSLYASAQLVAGSKALHVIFGWDYSFGIVLAAMIILIYCFSGGIRASIWTDSVQSVVMFLSMITVATVCLSNIGGPIALMTRLREIDPVLVDFFPNQFEFGILGFFIGWVFNGIGVIGQPHIINRFMAVKSYQQFLLARRLYIPSFFIFLVLTLFVALSCRVLIASTDFDSETAFLRIAILYLPHILTGFALAGLFSSTLSTADSQVLSCSSAITVDIFPNWRRSYVASKISTIFVTFLIMGVALLGNKNVFYLVVVAWAALSAAFVPIVTLRMRRIEVSNTLGLSMIFCGLGTVLLWRYYLKLSGDVYEAFPGICAGFLMFFLSCAYKKVNSLLAEVNHRGLP